jgi:hypothetical protein
MLNVNYTWSKAINFVANSADTPSIQSFAYMNLNRSVTGFDRTHNLQITGIWDLPFGRGRRWAPSNGVLNQIVSGWQVNNIFNIMSGLPFNVTGDCGASWPSNSPTMVDIVGTPKKIGSSSGYWYDPTAFAQTYDPSNPGSCQPGRLGSSGFNNLRGPGVFNWDFSVFREFAITERVHLQFRVESFNFTNTPHFALPDSSLGDANSFDPKTGRVIDAGSFMTIQGGDGVTDLAREGIDERQFRFGLRLSF